MYVIKKLMVTFIQKQIFRRLKKQEIGLLKNMQSCRFEFSMYVLN